MGPIRRQISPHASRLRRERTDAEDKLWQGVRNRQIEGFKLRFQHSIGPFVADFACAESRVVVELDGGQHGAKVDARRTAYLESQGWLVLRFWNNDVLTNLDGVVEVVRDALLKRAPEREERALTQPSPGNPGEG